MWGFGGFPSCPYVCQVVAFHACQPVPAMHGQMYPFFLFYGTCSIHTELPHLHRFGMQV